MKKFGVFLAVAMLAVSGFAGMADSTYSFSVVGAGTSTTSRAFSGWLEGAYIDVAAATTQTVTISTSEQTLYTGTVTADSWFLLRYAGVDSSGVSTANTTNATWWRAPLKGSVTVTVVGANGAATTNASTVKIIYAR
jgi:hypothetical protein